MPLLAGTPWTRNELLEGERIFPISQALVDAINAIRQGAKYSASSPAAVVVFYESMEPDTFLLPSNDPEIVAQYTPVENCKLRKTDYVVCVQYDVAGADPSWMIINNKRVHT